ncbi:hypothetical protein [Pseudoalteromonas ulvae]|uniref:Uncharacterized protein n=1 Tax=Pseudoalteromonas ulvae TaxID=107327 RepID=A0A244CUG9_PSEDV|nr:hypothetical protein [Pseudoalteromonas ulvae]OUL59272.1 hypothetical protein B1199_03105 [Pseudoalteromonas ulvae]
MIKIRFSQSFVANNSPTRIYFGEDNGGPVTPKIELAMECGFVWLSPAALVQQTTPAWQAPPVAREFVFSVQILPLISAEINKPWRNGLTENQQIYCAFGGIKPISQACELHWLTKMSQQQSDTVLNWRGSMALLGTERTVHWSPPTLLGIEKQQQWQGVARPIAREMGFYYGPSPLEYICVWQNHPRKGLVILRLDEPQTAHATPLTLRFGTPQKICYWGHGGGNIRGWDDIPVINRKISIEPQLRTSYFMQPTITCKRVSDDLDIIISSFNSSHSRSQFAATCSINFCSRIDYERALNQLLKITVNGYVFYTFVEQPSSSLKFGQHSYSATGRSRFAELAAPFTKATNFTNSTPKTFAGLLTDLVANTGWTINNQMLDYPVPALAYSHQNKTPAEAVKACAEALGAMLQVNDDTKVITVVPKWPVMPWDTQNAVCDVIINDSVILEHSSDQLTNPDANVVFVRGEQQGVAANVKRSGTLADSYANDVIDKLMTDAKACRQRGSCELANAGNKEQSTLRTKIMDDLPPIKPGMLVGIRYGSDIYKATCESCAITATVNQSTGAITVNQRFVLLKNA